MTRWIFFTCILLLSWVNSPVAEAQEAPPAEAVEQLTLEILSTRPHDPDAYTQGLLLHDGLLYESAGRYGRSNLRQVDPDTGAVLRQIDLPDYFFAEGLALVEDRLLQLTWREQVMLVYDFEDFINDTLAVVDLVPYAGEGWGLCYDGTALYMTDGSSTLYKRDPQTFEVLEEIAVTLEGAPLQNLNELECVEDVVYANVYTTQQIMRIDKVSGQITARIDASGLLTAEETATLGQQPFPLSVLLFDGQNQRFNVRRVNEGGFVLNGIAYDAEAETFLITGKMWPKLFEVRFVPAES